MYEYKLTFSTQHHHITTAYRAGTGEVQLFLSGIDSHRSELLLLTPEQATHLAAALKDYADNAATDHPF